MARAHRCSRSIRLLAIAAACAGCSDESARPSPAPPPPAPPPQDAAVDGVTALPSVDPASGMHLDDGPARPRTAQGRPRNRPSRPVDIMLKTEPRGAQAAVDGRPIGTTPTLWAGESDGLEHEFTFSLAGHATARYRFVPLTSGVLHAKLQPIASGGPDGGLEPVIAPTFAPDAAVPPSPDAVAPPPPPSPSPSSQPAPGSAGSAGSAPSPLPAPPAVEPRPDEPRPGGLAPTP